MIMTITYLFALPSVNDALADPSGLPLLYVFKQALPRGGVNALTVLILTLVAASNIMNTACTARETFAFARDSGLPWSQWISTMHPQRQIPVNSIVLSCSISIILCLINLGSAEAVNIIISLSVAAPMVYYFIPICCMFCRRLGQPGWLQSSSFRLGRAGVFVNLMALCYLMFSFFWSLWPTYALFNVGTFKWSCAMLSGTVIFCIGYYYINGRRRYKGPVADIRRSLRA
jgi:amino acid transporter